jgi:hypothetical protein
MQDADAAPFCNCRTSCWSFGRCSRCTQRPHALWRRRTALMPPRTQRSAAAGTASACKQVCPLPTGILHLACKCLRLMVQHQMAAHQDNGLKCIPCTCAA